MVIPGIRQPQGGNRSIPAITITLQVSSTRRFFMMPFLAALFSVVGVFGGYLIAVVLIGVDEGSFWSQMQNAVDFRYDIVNGVIKTCVFGVAVTAIAVFEGYDASPTAEGVSGATTRTVVTSALVILGLDFVLTSVMFRGMS